MLKRADSGRKKINGYNLIRISAKSILICTKSILCYCKYGLEVSNVQFVNLHLS